MGTPYTGLQYNDTSTLQGILQAIYFQGKCNVNTFDSNDLLRIVNSYYGKLQEAVRAVNENFYLAVCTGDLVIGDGSYTFPDGTGTAPAYEKIKSIWAAYQPADITTPLPNEYAPVNIIDPNSITNSQYVFSPDEPKAQIFGNYFVLLPLVTDVTKYPVTDGVKIYYISTQNSLANATDVPQIFPSFHDAIVTGSLIEVHKRLGNDEDSQLCEKRFAERLEEIKSYASDRIPEEISVVEGQELAGGWCFPWGFTSMS